MPVYRAETKFSTKKAGYSALSCVTATMILKDKVPLVPDEHINEHFIVI